MITFIAAIIASVAFGGGMMFSKTRKQFLWLNAISIIGILAVAYGSINSTTHYYEEPIVRISRSENLMRIAILNEDGEREYVETDQKSLVAANTTNIAVQGLIYETGYGEKTIMRQTIVHRPDLKIGEEK